MICNDKLKWKPRLAGARMNLRAGNNSEARKLLVHALREAAPKNKAQVLVEFARLEEIEGNIDMALCAEPKACLGVPRKGPARGAGGGGG